MNLRYNNNHILLAQLKKKQLNFYPVICSYLIIPYRSKVAQKLFATIYFYNFSKLKFLHNAMEKNKKGGGESDTF